MKKFIALLCALALILSTLPALAESREKPEDKKVITTDDVIGAETVFKKYDNKFYDAPSTQPGTVVRLDYTTTAYGAEQPGWVNVYLPYGYDENGTERYNVIYFLHGTNETQDSFIGDEKAKNALDNMIEVGVTAPFIMVFPTYYYDYETRSIDMEAFSTKEMRNDIMPAVESAYRTYAETADEAGFIASRDHRPSPASPVAVTPAGISCSIAWTMPSGTCPSQPTSAVPRKWAWICPWKNRCSCSRTPSTLRRTLRTASSSTQLAAANAT